MKNHKSLPVPVLDKVGQLQPSESEHSLGGQSSSAAASLSAGVIEQEWTNRGAIVCLGSTALFGCESEDHAKGATSAHNASVAALRERITQLEKALEEKKRRM